MSTLADIWREGQTLLDAKKRRQFIDYTYKALRDVPQEQVGEAYGTHFDRLIFVCQQLPDATEIAERCAALSDWDYGRNGETAWGLLGRSVGAMAEGDLDAMDAYIARSAGKPVFKRAAIALGVFSHRPPSYLSALIHAAEPPLPSTFTFEPRHAPWPNEIVHVVACDSVYLHKYAAPALNSSRDAGEAIFHLHIVNPDHKDMEFALALKGRVNISTEHAPFVDSLSPGRERAGYLINPRFIWAPALLEAYNQPLLITDIDAVILRPWEEIKSAMTGYDIGLRRVGGYYPWRRNAAGCTYLAPTPEGKAFARMVSTYIRSVLDLRAHKINWLIDQNALFCADRTSSASLRIRNINSPDFKPAELAQHLPGGKAAFMARDQSFGSTSTM